MPLSPRVTIDKNMSSLAFSADTSVENEERKLAKSMVGMDELKNIKVERVTKQNQMICRKINS